MTQPTRVTLLGLNFAPETTGIAPYTSAAARHLVQAGHSVHAVTGFPHYPQWRRDPAFPGWRASSEDAGVAVTRVTHWVPNPPRGLRRLVSEITFGLHQTATSWRKPAVTVFVTPALFSSAMCMARSRTFSRSKRVVWVQDLYSQGMSETDEGGGLAVRIAAAVERWTLRSADAVVAIHPAMVDRMVQDLGVERSRITVIPNWSHITVAEADRAAARNRLGWSESDFVVLHAGNMGKKQGLSNVVAAARAAEASNSPVKFVMLGDGAERGQLQASAAGCGSIEFVDPLPDEEFTAALQAADALLINELPGVREMAVPSKLTSYFATRRPVIAATDPEGIVASIMEAAGAGPVVRSGDPEALVQAAETLRDDPATATRAAEGGFRYFEERLTADGALAAWDTVIASLDAP